MKRLLLTGLGLLSLGMAVQKDISAEDAIADARQFLKDNDVQGKFLLTSCGRLDYKGRPKGFVWYVRMVKDGTTSYSLGLDSHGKLIWFEPESGEFRTVPETTEDWRKRATARANDLFAKLMSDRQIAQPTEDLMRFPGDLVFLPITVNGKLFVGVNLGYTFEFEPDMQLRRFSRNDEVPKVNVDKPVVKPEDALAEAKQSLEEGVKDQPNLKGHQFTFGKESLVYYYQPDMAEARLCWHFKVKAEYNYDFSSRLGDFGVVVDALTGKRIKNPTMLP